MSAQPDLLDAIQTDLVVNLRERTAWRSIPKTDGAGFLPFVVESFDGRYTITWSSIEPEGDAGEIFLAWRRGELVNGRRAMPTLISRHRSARSAREACAKDGEGKP